MDDRFVAAAAAGSLRGTVRSAAVLPHRWTEQGVSVEAEATGAHLLHLATAVCVLNDCYREAAGLGLRLDGVRVTAEGGFDPTTWTSTGITYAVELDAPVTEADVAALLAAVDAVAEVPRALRAGAVVRRDVRTR